MGKKPLRSQLNQVRSWVRQGRTDAWIAHQLEVSAGELREFRRRHGLDAESEGDLDADLRDEIEAEVEAAQLTEAAEAEKAREEDDADSEDDDENEDEDSNDSEDDDDRPKRRRRRRRGGGGGGRPGASMEAAFDHGEEDGYGLWLDPAISEDPIYAEHWKGHRPLLVTVEPDRIIIRRADS